MYLSPTRATKSTIDQSSPCKPSSKSQCPISKGLSSKYSVVCVLVVTPGTSPGARVEYLVGKILSSNTYSCTCSTGIYCVVTSKETGSLSSSFLPEECVGSSLPCAGCGDTQHSKED